MFHHFRAAIGAVVLGTALFACTAGGGSPGSAGLPPSNYPAPAGGHRTAPAGASGPVSVRFIEGAPLLETAIGGTPIGLGSSFLQVNGQTVASSFPYGYVTYFTTYPSNAISIKVLDSLGYSIGPFVAKLASGSRYTVALIGSYPHYRLLAFAEPKPASTASLGVYEASPDRPSVDFGSFNASAGTGFHQLGAATLGHLAVVSLGAHVTNFGAYAGHGTTPLTGGMVTPAAIDPFDASNKLPFHTVARLSLFVFDPQPGVAGPVIGVLDQ